MTTRLEATDVFERRAVEQDTLLMRKRKIAKVKDSIFFAIFFSKIFLPLSPTDDDECALSRHNCFDPYECHNTKGMLKINNSELVTESF